PIKAVELLSGPPEVSNVLRRLFRLLACDDSRKLDHFLRRITVLAQRGFERQFTSGDLTQGDIGVTHPGNEFDQRTVSNGELSNTAGNHVHENLLILDYFAGGFNKFGLHN